MRTLVISDIHGDWPVLDAVAAVPHDAVVCLGDIVGYGPQPGGRLRWLRASRATIVQGNHDGSVADGGQRPARGLRDHRERRRERVNHPVERTIDALGAAGVEPAAFRALAGLRRPLDCRRRETQFP